MLGDIVFQLQLFFLPQLFWQLLADVFDHGEHGVPDVCEDVTFLSALFCYLLCELV